MGRGPQVTYATPHLIAGPAETGMNRMNRMKGTGVGI